MAVYQQPSLFISQNAGQNFVLADRYKIVRITATGVKVGADTIGLPVGVLYSMSETNTAVKVLNKGIAICQCGESVVTGDRVTANATGEIVKVVTTAGSETPESQVVGIVQSPANKDALVAVLLTL